MKGSCGRPLSTWILLPSAAAVAAYSSPQFCFLSLLLLVVMVVVVVSDGEGELRRTVRRQEL